MKTRLFLIVICIFSLHQSSKGQQSDSLINSERFQISVIMPFCGKQLMEDPKHKNSSIGNASRQYYEGFVLALDSFKKSETPIEVKVYDTNRDSLTFKKILDKKEVRNSDFIVGPVLKEGNDMMLNFCKDYKIYHVSPFLTLTKSKIENPYLISAYPDLNYYADFTLEMIKNDSEENTNIIIVTGKEANDKVLTSRMISLKSKYPGYTIKQIDISKYTDIKNVYKLSKTNHIIINSENEFLVNSTLKYLADTNQFINLKVYGTRKWMEFKSPNIAQWEQLNVRLISPFFIDYHSQTVSLFIEKYRERYFTEPSEYSFVGYEQAIFFVQSLINYKGDLRNILDQEKSQPLSNWFLVRQKPDGKSLQNNLLNVIYFEDGKIKRLEN